MKLNIISDLHCDTKRDKVDWMDFDPTRLCPADYLIVAGDTGYDNTEQKIYSEMHKLTEGKFKDILWNSLNEDNKVSLFVRYIDIATGETKTKIVNKNV